MYTAEKVPLAACTGQRRKSRIVTNAGMERPQHEPLGMYAWLRSDTSGFNDLIEAKDQDKRNKASEQVLQRR